MITDKEPSYDAGLDDSTGGEMIVVSLSTIGRVTKHFCPYTTCLCMSENELILANGTRVRLVLDKRQQS